MVSLTPINRPFSFSVLITPHTLHKPFIQPNPLNLNSWDHLSQRKWAIRQEAFNSSSLCLWPYYYVPNGSSFPACSEEELAAPLCQASLLTCVGLKPTSSHRPQSLLSCLYFYHLTLSRNYFLPPINTSQSAAIRERASPNLAPFPHSPTCICLASLSLLTPRPPACSGISHYHSVQCPLSSSAMTKLPNSSRTPLPGLLVDFIVYFFIGLSHCRHFGKCQKE